MANAKIQLVRAYEDPPGLTVCSWLRGLPLTGDRSKNKGR